MNILACLCSDAHPVGSAQRFLRTRTDRRTLGLWLWGSLGLKGGTASLQPQGTPKTQRVTALCAGLAAGWGVPVSLVCPGFVTAGDGWAGVGARGAVPAPIKQFLARYLGGKERKKEIDNKIKNIKNNNSQAELEVLACISLSWITQMSMGRYMGMGRWA